MKKSIICASILALSICALGLFIKGGIDNFAFRDRDITVRGLAERTVEADYVTWPMGYSISGNDLVALYEQMQSKNDVVVKFLTDNGITSNEITIASPDIYNNESNYYGEKPKNAYTLRVSITVASANVNKVTEIISRMGELLKQGVAISSNYVDYEFTALNSIKPEMIAEATKNARIAADQFAADSQSKVGKIKTAYQGQFTIEDTAASTPQTKKVRVVSTIIYYLED